MTRILVLLSVLTLAACAAPEPPMPTGPWEALNSGLWGSGANALTAPPPSVPGVTP